MSYEILKPFGPPIYKTTISDEFLALLKTVSKQTRETQNNVGKTLVGNLQKQYSMIVNDEQGQQFMEEIKEHVFNAVYEFEKKYNHSGEEYLVKDKFRFNLGPGAWINYQQPGEFNPIHNHTGKLSAVIYIDVPECIAEENAVMADTSGSPSAGKIHWVYGSMDYATDYNYAHQPVTGELFIFPAGLPHIVYPFKSDVERISMSFNVYDLSTG